MFHQRQGHLGEASALAPPFSQQPKAEKERWGGERQTQEMHESHQRGEPSPIQSHPHPPAQRPRRSLWIQTKSSESLLPPGGKGEGRRDVYLSVLYFGILRSNFFHFKGWVFGGPRTALLPRTRRDSGETAAGDLGRGGALWQINKSHHTGTRSPFLCAAARGLAFVTRWETVGRSTLTHLFIEPALVLFIHSCTQPRASRGRHQVDSRPAGQSLHTPLSEESETPLDRWQHLGLSLSHNLLRYGIKRGAWVA